MQLNYEVQTRIETLKSGKQIYTPVARIKDTSKVSKLLKFLTSNHWQRIVKIEGTYMIMDIDFPVELTLGECEERKEGFKKELIKRQENDIISVIHTP